MTRSVQDEESLSEWERGIMLDTSMHHVPRFILMGLRFQLDRNQWLVKIHKSALADKIGISYSTLRGARFKELLESKWVEQVGEYGRETDSRPVYEPLLRLIIPEDAQ